ncbi:hypothetical protein AALA80_14645 [Oscillospiraceae bacterium 50-60]|nr:hypothetical protein [Oscillibacter sp.]
MMGCENCGGCGSCGGGCRREIVLTPPEAALLLRLGEVAFLPVARRNNSGTPVCLEEADYSSAEYGEALAWLELKGLVSLDYDLPLSNFDYAAYGENFLHGSAALTAAGQEAVEILELQGIEI